MHIKKAKINKKVYTVPYGAPYVCQHQLYVSTLKYIKESLSNQTEGI